MAFPVALALTVACCVAAGSPTAAAAGGGEGAPPSSSSILDVITPPLPVVNEMKTLLDIATGPMLVPVLRDGLKILCLVGAKAVVPVPGFDTVAAVAAYPLCAGLSSYVLPHGTPLY